MYESSAPEDPCANVVVKFEVTCDIGATPTFDIAFLVTQSGTNMAV
jgi:hypothetical protein